MYIKVQFKSFFVISFDWIYCYSLKSQSTAVFEMKFLEDLM